MTNFTMPNFHAANELNKALIEQAWITEGENIKAIIEDSTMHYQLKHGAIGVCMARFATMYNAYRNPTDVNIGPQPYYQPPQYQHPFAAQAMYNQQMGGYQQPHCQAPQQTPMGYQQPNHQQVITSHTLRITSESVDANNITHLAEFIYTTNNAVSLELCVVENDVVLLNIEDIRIASIAEDTDIEDGEEGVNLFHDSTVTALVIQLPEDTIRDIPKVLPGLAKVVANAVNQLLPYGKSKAYGAIMPTSIGNIITDSIVVELSREQSEYITKLSRRLLKGIQIYPRTQTLMQDTE